MNEIMILDYSATCPSAQKYKKNKPNELYLMYRNSIHHGLNLPFLLLLF